MDIETCIVDGCDNPSKTRQMCVKHYARWYRHGDASYTSNRSVENNPMYKHGGYCKPTFCECGAEKDYRSKKCAICSGTGYSLGKKDSDYKRYIVSESDIRSAIAKSTDYVKTATMLGISRGDLMDRLDAICDVDVSHFSPGRARPLSYNKIFINNSLINAGVVKRYILKHRILPYKCSECGLIPVWNGKSLTIQLHHINGDSKDNRLENLVFLCPNCHSQTSTFTGRKKWNGESGGRKRSER